MAWKLPSDGESVAGRRHEQGATIQRSRAGWETLLDMPHVSRPLELSTPDSLGLLTAKAHEEGLRASPKRMAGLREEVATRPAPA